MTAKMARIAIQVVATVAGLVGSYGVYFSIVHLPAILLDDISRSIALVFAAIFFILNVWFIWIAYLAWFRFSPQAVKQTCGFLGFLGFGLFLPLSDSLKNQIGDVGAAMVPIGLLVLVIIAYRLLSRYLIRVISLEPPVPLDSMPPLPKPRS